MRWTWPSISRSAHIRFYLQDGMPANIQSPGGRSPVSTGMPAVISYWQDGMHAIFRNRKADYGVGAAQYQLECSPFYLVTGRNAREF